MNGHFKPKGHNDQLKSGFQEVIGHDHDYKS
jgi:hypothetical protein